jgi:hypothetical protein
MPIGRGPPAAAAEGPRYPGPHQSLGSGGHTLHMLGQGQGRRQAPGRRQGSDRRQGPGKRQLPDRRQRSGRKKGTDGGHGP